MTSPQLLDVVALREDLAADGLVTGQVGTIVEILSPGVYEVEFSDLEGQTYALLTLKATQFLVLRYSPVAVA